MQFTGDDCWIGKQQQDIYCQCARTAGATGEMTDKHAENMENCYPVIINIRFIFLMQAGQYTSIYVDNAAGASITIQNGSDFMGILLGV